MEFAMSVTTVIATVVFACGLGTQLGSMSDREKTSAASDTHSSEHNDPSFRPEVGGSAGRFESVCHASVIVHSVAERSGRHSMLVCNVEWPGCWGCSLAGWSRQSRILQDVRAE